MRAKRSRPRCQDLGRATSGRGRAVRSPSTIDDVCPRGRRIASPRDARYPCHRPGADKEAQALREMEFIRRMRGLVQWAAPGRAVTQTGAMRRGDAAQWMRHFGLRVTRQPGPPSMWNIRGIGQPWDIAIETGMLSPSSTKVRPGPTGTVFESEDPVAQVRLGRSIVNLLLMQALSRSPIARDSTVPINTILIQLVAACCRPEGQDLAHLRDFDSRIIRVMREGNAAEQGTVLLCSAMLREMRTLTQFGLLTDLDGFAQVPAGLRPAVVAAIQGPGAPVAIEYQRSAVPIATDQ